MKIIALLKIVDRHLVRLANECKGQNVLIVDALNNLRKIDYLTNKLTGTIENMIAVERAAKHCPDCCTRVFCTKHDKAWWEFWEELKRI